MPRASIRAAIKAQIDTLVPSVLKETHDVPVDAQRSELALFPAAEIHYLRMESVNLTNHEYENAYYFGVVVYLDMANDLIGTVETQMDAIHDSIINLFANHQTLGGAVDVGLVPTVSDPVVIEWKGRNLYATMFVVKCRESIQTD